MSGQIEIRNSSLIPRFRHTLVLGQYADEIFVQLESNIRMLVSTGRDLYNPDGWPRIATAKEKVTTARLKGWAKSQFLHDSDAEKKAHDSLGKRIDVEIPIPGSSIQLGRSDIYHGRLSPKEATALVLLMTETAALAQAYKPEENTLNRLKEILDLPESGSVEDAINGFSEFGNSIGAVARIRDIILKQKPHHLDYLEVFERFKGPLAEDKMKIENSCCQAILGFLKPVLFYRIFYSSTPWGDTQYELVGEKRRELNTRVSNAEKGARLASLFYLEALGLVARDLPDTIDIA